MAGGYFGVWNMPQNPGWHMVGLIRYRSRRDAMLASLVNPMFQDIHKYKLAAFKQTFALQAQPTMRLYAAVCGTAPGSGLSAGLSASGVPVTTVIDLEHSTTGKCENRVVCR